MNKSQLTRITVVSIGLLVLLLSGAEARSVNLPSPQCHPSIISSMPPKIRKICDALSTIWEFSDAMENYLDEKGDFYLKRKCFILHFSVTYLLFVQFSSYGAFKSVPDGRSRTVSKRTWSYFSKIWSLNRQRKTYLLPLFFDILGEGVVIHCLLWTNTLVNGLMISFEWFKVIFSFSFFP